MQVVIEVGSGKPEGFHIVINGALDAAVVYRQCPSQLWVKQADEFLTQGRRIGGIGDFACEDDAAGSNAFPGDYRSPALRHLGGSNLGSGGFQTLIVYETDGGIFADGQGFIIAR